MSKNMTNGEWRMAKRGSAAAVGLLIAIAVASSSALAQDYAIRAGKIVTMDAADTVHNNAVLLIKDGKIEAVGPADQTRIPDGYEVIDASDLWLTPGLVDCHNHTSGGLGDLNDMVYLANPGLDTLPTIEPNNQLIKRARTGGVTSVLLIPGSGTNLSGFGTITKTGGDTLDEVIIRSPGSLKIAQAGNPERYWTRVGRSFMNWNTRQTMEKARDYNAAWEAYEKGESRDAPEFDPFFDGFRGLFQRKFPVSVHTQMYQVLMTTLDMLTTKLKLWTVLDHCTFDAWKLGPLVNETDAWTINGPRQYHFDRATGMMIGNASGWWKNGVRKLGINTDAPVVPEEQLSYQAAMACWYGWLPYPALRGVTTIPAQALGLDDTGSIEPGKLADLGVWTGNPIDPRSACLITFVRGRIVYDGRTATRRF
jgi:imidazolonepropionase-like amidohydrolase